MVWSEKVTFVIMLLKVMVACGDKIFITDLEDSAIFVGENNGSNFFSSSFRQLSLTGVEDPVGVDYDYRNDMVYWTDESNRTISRAKLDGSMQETLVEEFQGVGYPEGIVLDLEDDRMIWTDTLLEKIESANLDGTNRKTIVDTGLYLPWSITLSQKRRMLYWTEHGDDSDIKSKIEMSNKNGLDRRAIVSNNIRQPNGLALDSQEQRLYWTESYYDRIESIDLATYSDRQVHVYANSGDIFVFGISLYFNSIYFTEFSARALFEADLGSETIRTVSIHAFPAHVRIYADLTCPDPSVCTGHSTCEMIAYQTPACTCLPGYTGASCNEVVTCSLPADVSETTHYENPRSIYYNEETLVEVCDNGYDERTHVCNGYTGSWYTSSSINCTIPNNPDIGGDKIFITDLEDNAIFVGENNGSNFFSSSFRQLNLTGVEDPVGVDYDYRNDMVYWTDESTRTISRAKLDGSMQETLVQEFQGVGYPEGIVLDLEEDRMIWTDTLLEKIESANLDGTNRKTIVDTGLYLPWSITLSQKRKMLYWTEHGDASDIRSKIEMSNKNGLDRRAIVSNNIRQPNGLALDSQEQRLYWTESYYDQIESIDLDTYSDRHVHVYARSGDIYVFGISLYFNSIYFTEFSASTLFEADLGSETIRTVSIHAFPVHVKIYADLTCPDPSVCAGHSTCEMIAYQTPACTCLPGYTGVSCNEVITCSLPVDVSETTHYENPRSIYYNDETLVEVCDNGYDERTLVCNGYTGSWYISSSIDCTTPKNPDNEGLSESTVIAISCSVCIVVLILGILCILTYKRSRRNIPPSTQDTGPVGYQSNIPTISAQGGPAVSLPPIGASGGTSHAPPLPEKGPLHAWQAAPPPTMPPPEYSYVVYNPDNAPGQSTNNTC